MKDKTLIKVALAWSLIGIVALLLVSEFTEPDRVKVIELADYMGKIVYIQGNVTRATYAEKVTIFEVDDGTSEINVVVFEKMNETIDKSDEIRVYGKVETYKNQLEIIAEKIDCLRCG